MKALEVKLGIKIDRCYEKKTLYYISHNSYHILSSAGIG